jgi:hypothetical protein
VVAVEIEVERGGVGSGSNLTSRKHLTNDLHDFEFLKCIIPSINPAIRGEIYSKIVKKSEPE